MKHFGDITKINGANVPAVDVITGGSPCQDLSVAGKRAGLAGERSGLFMEQIRIIKEMRNEHERKLSISGANYNRRNIKPRFMVWENVPGAFSSNGGEDFRAVLEETARVAESDVCIPQFNGKWPHAGAILGNGWSLAWRTHDAQFWGVPQRRKRIALVVDFGGNTAPPILFERESMPRNFEPGEETQQGSSRSVTPCAGSNNSKKPMIANAPVVLEGNGARPSHNGDEYAESEVSFSLNTIERHGVAYGLDVGHPNSVICEAYQHHGYRESNTFGTLTAEQNQHVRGDTSLICANVVGYSQDAYDKYSQTDVAASLKQSGGNYGGGYRNPNQTIGALCARDYKGVGSQYVDEGKIIIQEKEDE